MDDQVDDDDLILKNMLEFKLSCDAVYDAVYEYGDGGVVVKSFNQQRQTRLPAVSSGGEPF